jgi:dihydroorotase
VPLPPHTRITIARPDDWHLHLRDGTALEAVLPDTVRRFGRAIVMPNLRPPVASVDAARSYRERIQQTLEKLLSRGIVTADEAAGFEPLMTLYLTPATTPGLVREAADSGLIFGIKLYPAGATTNSESGVSSLEAMYPVFEAMQNAQLPLQIHGEVTEADVDIFDRERVFIERHLAPIVARFPGLRIVLEHITTKHAVEFIEQASPGVAATITPHHLLMNRNALFAGGIRPHHYCLPILKREDHRQALVSAALGDSPKFFAGTDSAPHAQNAKENACGCAGIYNSHGGIEFYAEVFDEADALVPRANAPGSALPGRFEDFMSRNGPAFYRLPVNAGTVTLEKRAHAVPEALPLGAERLVPMRAGDTLAWSLVSESRAR